MSSVARWVCKECVEWLRVTQDMIFPRANIGKPLRDQVVRVRCGSCGRHRELFLAYWKSAEYQLIKEKRVCRDCLHRGEDGAQYVVYMGRNLPASDCPIPKRLRKCKACEHLRYCLEEKT
jgi:hypothetical protein